MVEPRELVSSRGKLVAFLALCLGFVAIAVLVPGDSDDATWRWLCGGLFGLGAVVFVVSLVRPQRVLLDADGFTVSGGLARAAHRTAWRDVEGFFVYRLPRGGRMIGFNHAPHARAETYLGDMARHFAADGALPKTLPGKPEAIVAELNAYRAAALAGG